MLASSKKYQVSRGRYAIHKINSYSQNNAVPVWLHARLCKVHFTTGLEGPQRESVYISTLPSSLALDKGE